MELGAASSDHDRACEAFAHLKLCEGSVDFLRSHRENFEVSSGNDFSDFRGIYIGMCMIYKWYLSDHVNDFKHFTESVIS